MSIEVPIPQLFDELDRWGFCYLLTVSEGERPHLVALRPAVHGDSAHRVLRFDAGGGRACRNASARPDVTIVFPPSDRAGDEHAGDREGMSLVVDGTATVGGDFVDVAPTSAVLHRKAPPAPSQT